MSEAAVSAQIDQLIAETEHGLDLMIETGKSHLARGLDRASAIAGLKVTINLFCTRNPAFHDEIALGLAIAIVRLAEGESATTDLLRAAS